MVDESDRGYDAPDSDAEGAADESYEEPEDDGSFAPPRAAGRNDELLDEDEDDDYGRRLDEIAISDVDLTESPDEPTDANASSATYRRDAGATPQSAVHRRDAGATPQSAVHRRDAGATPQSAMEGPET
jgi:hypothetical protein